MKYRNVGKAGIKVSEIALGSWMTDLKESSEEDVAKEVVKLAYENGILRLCRCIFRRSS